MKRKRRYVLPVAVMMFLLASCGNVSTSKSYTFSVDNGDQVVLKLDTGDNYDITSEIPFVISQDGETISQGSFIQGEYYDAYIEAANTEEGATVLETGEKDGNSYVFWNYNDEEYNYVILVGNSSTGIILGNTISEESAKEAFQRLTISAE